MLNTQGIATVGEPVSARRNRSACGLCSMLLLAALAVWGVHRWVSAEQTFYSMDFSNHWVRQIEIKARFEQDPVAALQEVIYTVRHSEYNSAGALLLLPASFLLGTSREAFIDAIALFLALPGALALSGLLVWMSRQTAVTRSVVGIILPWLVVLTLPVFWRPTLLGYVATAGLAPMALVLWLYLRRPPGAHGWGALLGMALGLVSLVLFHKWYAVWAAAFLLSAGIDGLCFAGFNFKRLWPVTFQLLFLSLASAGLVFGLAWPLATSLLHAGYADKFSYASRHGNLFSALREIPDFLGWPVAAVAGYGVWVALSRMETRRSGLLMLVLSLAVFFLFRTQMNFIDRHHYTMLVPGLVAFIVWGLADLLRRWPKGWPRMAGWACIATYGALNLGAAFFPAFGSIGTGVGPLLTSIRDYPEVRHDQAEMARLVTRLAALSTSEWDRVYVVGTSMQHNQGIVENAHLSLGVPRTFEDHLVFSSGVDIWNGFPSNLLEARYVMLFDPPQYFGSERFQRVVQMSWQSLMEKRDIGAAYVQLAEKYSLEGGVQALLFERVRPLKKSEIEAFAARFREFYPDRPNVYTYRPPYDMIYDSQ